MELQMLELGVDLMLRRRLPSEMTRGMDDVEDGLRATRRHRRRLLADEQHLEPHRLLPRAAPPDEAPTENGCIVASPFERVTMPRRRFPPTGENARKDAVRGRAYSLELGEATVPSVRTGEDARKEEGAALRLPRRNGCRFAGGTPPSRRPKRKTTSTATLDGGARRTMSSARFSGERGHRVGKEQRGGPAAAAIATLWSARNIGGGDDIRLGFSTGLVFVPTVRIFGRRFDPTAIIDAGLLLGLSYYMDRI